MNESSDRKRVGWTTRINLRPAIRDAVRELAREEKLSMATVIGNALDGYVTARSTAA